MGSFLNGARLFWNIDILRKHFHVMVKYVDGEEQNVFFRTYQDALEYATTPQLLIIGCAFVFHVTQPFDYQALYAVWYNGDGTVDEEDIKLGVLIYGQASSSHIS